MTIGNPQQLSSLILFSPFTGVQHELQKREDKKTKERNENKPGFPSQVTLLIHARNLRVKEIYDLERN